MDAQSGTFEVDDQRGHGVMLLDQAIMWRLVEMGGPATQVYIVLAGLASQYGEAFPSIRKIEELCGMSRSSVYTALDRLEACMLIRREVRTRTDGGRSSNRYVLLPVCRPAVQPQAVAAAPEAELELTVETVVPAPPSKTRKRGPRPEPTADVHVVLDGIEKVLGGVVDWGREAGAAKRILDSSFHPTPQEILSAFKVWARGRRPEYGYSLCAFGSSAALMIKRMREQGGTGENGTVLSEVRDALEGIPGLVEA